MIVSIQRQSIPSLKRMLLLKENKTGNLGNELQRCTRHTSFDVPLESRRQLDDGQAHLIKHRERQI